MLNINTNKRRTVEVRQHGAETRPARGRPRKRLIEEHQPHSPNPGRHLNESGSNQELNNAAIEQQPPHGFPLTQTRRVIDHRPVQLLNASPSRQPSLRRARALSPVNTTSILKIQTPSPERTVHLYPEQFETARQIVATKRQRRHTKSDSSSSSSNSSLSSSSSESNVSTSSSSETTSNSDSDDSGHLAKSVKNKSKSTSKKRYKRVPIAVPKFQIEQNIVYFINDMKAYLKYLDITKKEQAQIVVTCITGEARDIVSGYSKKQLNEPKYLFRVLRKDFKKREQHVDSLFQLKQEPQEKVSVFVGRIRHHVSHLGLKHKYVDRTCLRYLRLGALQFIQTRIIQRDPRRFSKAVKLAIEAELEGGKGKPKARLIEAVTSMAINNKQREVEKQIEDLSTIVKEIKETQERDSFKRGQQQQYSHNRSDKDNNKYKAQRAGNGIQGSCYFCHLPGHGFRQCRKATERDKETIEQRIDTYKQQKNALIYRRNPNDKASNSNVAIHMPRESQH